MLGAENIPLKNTEGELSCPTQAVGQDKKPIPTSLLFHLVQDLCGWLKSLGRAVHTCSRRCASPLDTLAQTPGNYKSGHTEA